MRTGIPKWGGTRDTNEPLIIDALEASGWGVHQINSGGFPDLVTARNDETLLIEVIGEEKRKKYWRNGGLTPTQVEFHRNWPGIIYTVESVQDVLQIVTPRRLKGG